MSQFTEKERMLMSAVIQNLNGPITSMVNWKEAAIDAGYKDATNAKTMWGRLAKKISSGQTAGNNANDNAGESSSKKRKPAGAARKAIDRPTKKIKATGAQFTPINKDADTEATTESKTTEEAAGASEA